MKVLWLCNIILPRIAEKIGEPAPVFGGWLTAALQKLISIDEMDVTVVFPFKEIIDGNVTNNFKYFSFLPPPRGADMPERFKYILEKTQPDLVHIWGTEYKHTLEMVETCERSGILDKVIIDIQGLVSVYAKHYYAFLPQKVINSCSFRDFIRHENIASGRRNFERRGQLEEQAIRKVKHVMGRTDWDYACVKRLNPDVNYHLCNEMLRDSFYKAQWDLDKCEKHSIFISQSSYPIKGFHIMLEAMTDILKRFPDANLYTTGIDPIRCSLHYKIRQTSYTKYIAKLIRKNNLDEHVHFLGFLNETEMCERFTKSHVFASPSSIENSSNSICEAMIVGCPVVSSDVGGIKSLMTHDKEGYIYQADAPYMLAYCIINLFEHDELALKFSENARLRALKTHDRDINLKTLIDIYNNINNGAGITEN